MHKRFIAALAIATIAGSPVWADYTVRTAAGLTITIADFEAGGKHYPVHVNVNGSGTEVGTSSNPLDFREQAIRDRIGANSSPAAGSSNRLLTDLLARFDGNQTIGYTGTLCRYVAAGVTMSNGEINIATCDSTGKLQVSGAGGSSGGLTNTELRATPVPVSSTALGATSDAAWTTGAGSMVSLLKAIATVALDPSAGHVIIDSSAAIPVTNSNLTALGAQADAAWATGSGSVVALLKTLATVALDTSPAHVIIDSGVGLKSTSGGLLPGQARSITTLTTLTANAITTIDIARSGRLAFDFQMNVSPSANVYLCWNPDLATTCSATLFDKKVLSGALDGLVYATPFGFTNTVVAFTTGTGVSINASSWTAQ